MSASGPMSASTAPTALSETSSQTGYDSSHGLHPTRMTLNPEPISLSSPRNSPSSSAAITHTVTVSSENDFFQIDPQSLNVPTGDMVLFYSPDSPLYLYNSAFEKPCDLNGITGYGSHNSLWYQVNDTGSSWLVACNSTELCHCRPSSHFALNPGNQSSQFFDKVQSLFFDVILVPWQRPTVTTTTVVTAYK